MASNDYRKLLAAMLVLTVAVAGCLQLGDGDVDTPSQALERPSVSDTPSKTASDTEVPIQTAKTAWWNAPGCAEGEIIVSFDPTVPDDVTVKNATEDGFLEVDPLAAALTSAQRAYADHRNESATKPIRLTTVSNESVLAHDEVISEKIGYADATYVEFENVTYRMKYLLIEC